jgi:hypothetical protein
MLRLSLVFLLLLASTAAPLDAPLDAPRDALRDAQLHEESLALAWLEGDARQRALLESAERDGYHYRRLTDTNVRTIMRGDECAGADPEPDQGRTHAGDDPR